MVEASNPPLPPAPSNTGILGIHASDVIIKSAVEAALHDIRLVNPWLLDYVFAGLPQDALTAKRYGAALRQTAKDWLVKTHVPVAVTPVLDELKAPLISITLVSSQEETGEATLGDVDANASWNAFEGNTENWPDLTSPLTVDSWDPLTGTLAFRELPEDINLAPGMAVRDAGGGTHQILEVVDDLTCVLGPGTTGDFQGSTLRSGQPAWLTLVESSSFRETYRIGVHVGGEPGALSWLHSAVVFSLLRYKQALLEARGFERSTLRSTDLERNPAFETELVHSRYIEVTGYVRQWWPKIVTGRIDAVRPRGIRVIGSGTLPGGTDPNDQLWIGDQDVLSNTKK